MKFGRLYAITLKGLDEVDWPVGGVAVLQDGVILGGGPALTLPKAAAAAFWKRGIFPFVLGQGVVISMKVATVALASVLFLGAASAVAQIDSRIDSNASTGTGVPTSSGGRSSSASPISGRVYIITKIPPKSASQSEQPSGLKPSHGGKRH
jgi:hypothetical protein